MDFKAQILMELKLLEEKNQFDIVNACKTSKDIFATELILRMERSGFYMCEIPLEIEERRPPSINLIETCSEYN